MTQNIHIQDISPEAFAPFGEIIQIDGSPDKIINMGMCGRYHDRASLDVIDGRMGLSLFDATPRELPYDLTMMERHPLGSQCFIPMARVSFLVIVAEDDMGRPARPLAFQTKPGQAINFHKNTWHGVLTPLHAPGLFAVIDRIGEGQNLEEFFFDTPYVVASEF